MKFIVIVAICFSLSFFSVLDLGCNHVNEQHEKIIRIDVLENLDGLQWGYLCLYTNDSSNDLKYGFTKDTMQIEDQVFDQLKNRINNSTFKVNYTNKKYSDRDPIKKDMVYITVIYNDENGLVKDGLIFIFPEDALNFFSLFEDVLSNEDILRVWNFLKFKLDKKLPSFEDIGYSQDTHQFDYDNLISASCDVSTSIGGICFDDDKALSVVFNSDPTIRYIRINGGIANIIKLNLEEFLTLKDAIDSCKVEKIEGIGEIENNYYYLVFSVVYNFPNDWTSAVSFTYFPEDSDIFYSILEENWSKEKIDILRSYINKEREKYEGNPSILIKKSNQEK